MINARMMIASVMPQPLEAALPARRAGRTRHEPPRPPSEGLAPPATAASRRRRSLEPDQTVRPVRNRSRSSHGRKQKPRGSAGVHHQTAAALDGRSCALGSAQDGTRAARARTRVLRAQAASWGHQRSQPGRSSPAQVIITLHARTTSSSSVSHLYRLRNDRLPVV